MCLAVLIPVLYFSEYVPVVIILAALSCVAVFEISCCFGIDPGDPFIIPWYAAAAALPFLVRYWPGPALLKAALSVGGLMVIYGFSYATLSRGRLRFSRAASAMLFIAYVLAGVNCILIVRDNAPYSGRFMFMLILLGAWVTDAGAQFSGIAFGKHKLIEEVSPHKTVEGAIGGAVCGVAGYVVYCLAVRGIYHVQIRWVPLIILGVVIAVTDQLGDLIASYVKREFGIKDYGWLFPGHGGAVDRLDSIVSNAIVIASYIVLGLPGIFITR